MKYFIVLVVQISFICGLLSGCDKSVTTEGNGESTAKGTRAFEKIYQVNDVSLSVLESYPTKLIITASGTVPMAGWTSPQLTPYQYVQPPPDGIYDYTFVALPPDGLVAQVLNPISTSLALENIPSGMKGVRIHAVQNNKVAMLQQAPVAYFEFKGSDPHDRFVIKLTEQEKITHARALISGQVSEQRSVMGIIIKERVKYNPNWSYYLDPTTIEFFDMAMEVCDSNMRYVEEHLDDVGGAFLPENRWCPWNSELTREIGSP